MVKVKPVAMMGTSIQHKLDLRIMSYIELLTELLYSCNRITASFVKEKNIGI